MDYLSFDLRLGEWDPATQTGVAEVQLSPAGEGKRYQFLLKLDPTEINSRQRTAESAAELGKKLTASVLSPESQALWHESYQIARERRRGLRLRLHIDSWELSRLPWELLYDERRSDFAVFDPIVSLTRYIRLQTVAPALRQSHSLKVLVASASPRDQLRLDWEREQQVLCDALRELIDAGQVEVIPCERTTHDRLHMSLLEHTPDVVHFIGHGSYDTAARRGFLLLENEDGTSAPLGATEMARLLRRYGANLVVLNACETAQGAWAGLGPSLVRAEIPAVVAMQWPVEDRAAIRFSRAFYRALALGRTIDECVAEGRVGAAGPRYDPNDWAAPVLFLRSVSGKLWTNDVKKIGERRPASPPLPERPAVRSTAQAPGHDLDGEQSFYFKTRGPLLAQSETELMIERPELRRAIRLAQQPSVTQYIAFLSARQTGKTTLLFRLINLLQGLYTCVFIDLSVLRVQDTKACFRFIAFHLVNEFRNLLGEEFFLPETLHIESSVDFLEFLRALAEALPMPRIIILLDEVGALMPQVSDAFFNTLRTVFTQGRGLNAQLSKYLFIFSGAVDLYTLTYGANSPLNICEKLYLRDFDLPDVHKIVGQFARLSVEVPPEAATQIYDLTGGHPYLTMRLCALIEHAQAERLTPDVIEQAAAQMLVEDDNVRHVIHELEKRPQERRRLRSILIEGRAVPFSRNDPVLASLEMIGAIRAVQPCAVRNRLYERALRQYYAEGGNGANKPEPVAGAPDAPKQDGPDLAATYGRLQTLRTQALDAEGAYQKGRAWETFAAAVFSLVPSFSVYPDVHTDTEQLDLVLAINGDAPGGGHWSIYAPAILVECKDLREAMPQRVVSELVGKATLHNIKLVLVMTSGGATDAAEQQARYSGARGDTYIVLIDDSEIARLLDEQADLDTFLRTKVLEARLRKI